MNKSKPRLKTPDAVFYELQPHIAVRFKMSFLRNQR
jgi:hypothetical protein